MGKMVPRVQINPSVLTWARESVGVSLEAVATRLNTDVETVAGWEKGQKQPTLGTLESLAVFFKRPLAAFFLPEPPPEPPIPTDFRVLPGNERLPLSKKTRLAIREAQRLHALAKELLDEMEVPEEMAVGTARRSDDPEQIAVRERKKLGISLEEQSNWKNSYEAFRAWRRAVERLSVLVFQLPMSLKEARGFSLADRNLSAITVNSSDVINAKIFTLFHEYAHLLLGVGGLCVWAEELETGWAIEKFCNHFAGALLVPAEALRADKRLKGISRPEGLGDKDLTQIATRFRVSKQVVWRRMQLIGLISLSAYQVRLTKWPEQVKKPEFVPNVTPDRRCVEGRGRMFANLVLEAKARDIITYKDVGDYLSIRLRHLEKVESLVRGAGNR